MSFRFTGTTNDEPTPTADLAIQLQGVSKSYLIYNRPIDRLLQMFWRGQRRFHDEIRVLEDITFEVARGETVGLLGRNGAGKSTLLQIIAGTLQPTNGRAILNGRVAPLIELGTGFNPEFSGLENISFYAMLLGMDEDELDKKFDTIVNFADIGSYIERPVKTYSSGMYARLAFAVAMHIDPEILLVDEILAVGDLPFQQKCINKFYEIKEQGCTIVLVAHDEYLIRSFCTKTAYLKNGELAEFGLSKDVVSMYLFDIQSSESTAADVRSPGEKSQFSNDLDTANEGSEQSNPLNLEISQMNKSSSSQKHFQITDIKLLSKDSQPVETITCGDTVRLCVSFKTISPDPPRDISFVFNLYRHDGLYICGSTTLMEGHASYRSGNLGEVTITFPRLSILSGHYIWRVAINDSGGMLVLAEAKGVCPFKVEDQSRSLGIFDLDRVWSVKIDKKIQANSTDAKSELPTKFVAAG